MFIANGGVIISIFSSSTEFLSGSSFTSKETKKKKFGFNEMKLMN